MENSRLPFLKSFSRAQVSSLTATVVDFGSFLLLFKIAHVWYVTASVCGAVLGAITNFLLGRYWSFHGHMRGRIHGQALKYAIVSASSLVINTIGVYCFTEYVHLSPPMSKITSAVMVGWFFNFPLHKFFVFR